MPLNMQDFCDTDGRLKGPFVLDGWEYATDGSVAIRRKTDKPNTEQYWRIPKTIASIFEIQNAVDETTLPIVLPTFEPCSECEDRVFTWEEVECDECYGTGESKCHTCGHVDDCDECDGTGKVDEQIKCDHCEHRYTVSVNEKNVLKARLCLLLAKNGVREVRPTVDNSGRFEIVDGDDKFDGIVLFAVRG